MKRVEITSGVRGPLSLTPERWHYFCDRWLIVCFASCLLWFSLRSGSALMFWSDKVVTEKEKKKEKESIHKNVTGSTPSALRRLKMVLTRKLKFYIWPKCVWCWWCLRGPQAELISHERSCCWSPLIKTRRTVTKCTDALVEQSLRAVKVQKDFWVVSFTSAKA